MSKLTLKELMQVCWNAGKEVHGLSEVNFSDWWHDYGEDRHSKGVQEIGDLSEAVDIITGLYRSLGAVIQTANDQGSDYLAVESMKWGRRSQEFIAKMEKNDVGK